MSVVDRVSEANGFDQGNQNVTPMSYNPAMNNGMQRPTMSNPLSQEEYKLLLTQEDRFNLQVSPTEIAKAVCTHKHPDKGTFATVPGNEAAGDVTCTICHEKFYPDLVDEQYVQDATNAILNVLQTIKYIGVDLNNDVIRQYFSMIPYITRIPKLYKIVNSAFQKYHMTNPVVNQAQPNFYGLYNSLVNPSVPLGVPAAPNYNPYYNPQYNMQNNMVNGGNPFYTNQPQQPYQQPQYGQPAMNQPYNSYNPYAQYQQPYQQQTQQPVQQGPVAPATPPVGTNSDVKVNQQIQL